MFLYPALRPSYTCPYTYHIPPAAHFSPALTTIDQKTDVAGALLVEKLMQQIDGAKAQSTLLPTQMVVRET